MDKTLQKIEQYLKKNATMEQVLSAPALDAPSKGTVVQTLSKVVSANKATENFLNVLAENNRLGLLRGVIKQFSTLMKAHRNEVEAIVWSAQVCVYIYCKLSIMGGDWVKSGLEGC